MADFTNTLLVMTIIQLTLTDITPVLAKRTNAIQPPMDKRYRLFNFIATKMYEENSEELLRKGLAISKILQYGNSFLEAQKYSDTYDAQTHQDVKKDVEYFRRAVANLKKDKLNCDLQQEMNDSILVFKNKYDGINITKLFSINDRETMERFDSIHNEFTKETRQEFKALLNQLYDQLPTIIRDFMQSLDDLEQQENEALLKWCQDFLSAPNAREKYYVFQRFSTFYLDLGASNGGNDNIDCQWDRSHFEAFIHKMLIWAQPSIPGFA